MADVASLSGQLLPIDATAALEAVPKQQVDAAITAHEAAGDPHPGYTTTAELATAIDGVVPVAVFQSDDHAMKAWNQDIGATAAFTALPTAGLANLIRVPIRKAVSVTTILIYIGTAGSGLTSGQCFASLHAANGTLIGVTPDQSGVWNATGVKTMTLTGGPFTVQPPGCYVNLWFNGTTGPALARSGNLIASAANVGLSAPNFRHASANTGLTTTAPNPFGTQTATGTMWWVGLV